MAQANSTPYPRGVNNYHYKHGATIGKKTPIYGAWLRMRAKHIALVSDEWRDDFSAFREWANNNGYQDGLKLDRKDYASGFCPANCLWSMMAEIATKTSPFPVLSGVEFRIIPEYAKYAATTDGDIWSCWKGVWRKLRPAVTKPYGYLQVNLANADGHKSIWVHQLVLRAFVGPCPDGMECRHFPDRDPTNNRPENLQWGTPKRNQADKVIHGTYGTKLSFAQVLEIRARYAAGGITLQQLADEYGVVMQYVWALVHYRSWATAELTPEQLDTLWQGP